MQYARYILPFLVSISLICAQATIAEPQAPLAQLRPLADRALSAASLQVRARNEGMVVYLLDLISRGRLGDEKSARIYDDRVKELQDILDKLAAGRDPLSEKSGQFEWAYLSQVDHSGQPVIITLPPDYDNRTPLPLVIALHGSGGNHHFGINLQGAPACILLGVDGRGDSDYEGLGEQDILDATAFVTANFAVDPARVVVAGHSMGGGGALRMAARYPGIYSAAVPISGWATALELGNVIDMPVDIYHGSSDWVVPVDFMRLALGDLTAGKRIHYKEYLGKGHSIYDLVNSEQPLSILNEVSSCRLPRELDFTTDRITHGRYRWIGIERLIDTSRPGSVRIGAGRSSVYCDTHNVEVLRLYNLHELFAGSRSIDLQIDGESIWVDDIFDNMALACCAGHWLRVSTDPPKQPIYQRRGCFNIYDGQPITIIAPKNWRDSAGLKALIEKWSSMSCPGAPAMPYGRIPVVEAQDFNAKAYKGHLILVGGPDENPLVSELLPRLPVNIKNGEMLVDGVGRYPLKSTALHMTCRNPYSPESRLVWLLNSTAATIPLDLPLPDGDGCSPDILIHDMSGITPVLIAAANFGNDWSCPNADGAKYSVNVLSRRLALGYLRGLKADYVLYQPSDWEKDTWFGARRLSISSLKALLPPGLQPICRARLTPEQLAGLSSHLKGKMLLFSDAPKPKKALYEVVFDESLIWKLGCNLRYEFPKDSLSHTGADVSDFVEMPVN